MSLRACLSIRVGKNSVPSSSSLWMRGSVARAISSCKMNKSPPTNNLAGLREVLANMGAMVGHRTWMLCRAACLFSKLDTFVSSTN